VPTCILQCFLANVAKDNVVAMETIDWIELIFGLVWGTVMLILWRQNKSNPKIWPPIFGIGGGTFMLAFIVDDKKHTALANIRICRLHNFQLPLVSRNWDNGLFQGSQTCAPFPKFKGL